MGRRERREKNSKLRRGERGKKGGDEGIGRDGRREKMGKREGRKEDKLKVVKGEMRGGRKMWHAIKSGKGKREIDRRTRGKGGSEE